MADRMRYRLPLAIAVGILLASIAYYWLFFGNEANQISSGGDVSQHLPTDVTPVAAPETTMAIPSDSNSNQNGLDGIESAETLASRLRATPSDDVLGIVDVANSQIEPIDLRLHGALSALGDNARAKAGELTELRRSGATNEQVRSRIDDLFPGIREAEARMHALAWWRTSFGIPEPDLPEGLGRPPVNPTAIQSVRVGDMPDPSPPPLPNILE